MTGEDRNALIALPFILLVGGALAWVGSYGGTQISGIPVFALCVGVAFLVQWLVFIPSFVRRTEGFFDLTGGFTYILVAALAAFLGPPPGSRHLLLLLLVTVWAARLAVFLFRRIQRAGKDDRFDQIKASFPRFLSAWTLQGLWVSFTLAAALAAITSTVGLDLDLYAAAGLLIWILGFSIEVVADRQKSRFRQGPENRGRFINTGLWVWSRHPNYFGEIVLWLGIAVIAFPALQGLQWVTLISPVFVYVLLARVSGVPLLEKKADAKWGGQEEYEAYKARTPVLVLWPPRPS